MALIPFERLESFKDYEILTELRTGEVFDSSIECHECTIFFDRKAKKAGVSYLLMAQDAPGEPSREADPTLRHFPIPMLGMAFQ